MIIKSFLSRGNANNLHFYYLSSSWKYHTYGEINIDLPCILKTFYQAYELDYFCFSKNLQMSREERFEYVLLTTFLKEYVLNVTSEGCFWKFLSWKETWILLYCFLQKRWNLYYITKPFEEWMINTWYNEYIFSKINDS